MTDPTPHPDPDGDYPGAPRWVKAFGMTLFALILLLVVLRLAGGGRRHGPGRHMSPAEPSAGSATAPGKAEHLPQGDH